MRRNTQRRVLFLTTILTRYRVPFHETVRCLLSAKDIDYVVAYGQPDSADVAKNDTAHLSWGKKIKNKYIKVSRETLVWQPALPDILAADLVILGQENKHLVNYLLQSTPRRLRPLIALFGHGRSFQARNSASQSEKWKRFWATKADWWFGYTDETRKHLLSLGYPDKQITVFNNAVDTESLRMLAQGITQHQLEQKLLELGMSGNNIGIFVGSLYPDKRINFLITAADRIRNQVLDFELIIVGGGSSTKEIMKEAETRPWLKFMGPCYEGEKVELMLLSKLFLMPGLVGLAILDAATLGLPVVTTNYPWHSPEIAYMRDGESGLIVAPYDDVNAYADAVIELLSGDPAKLQMMSEASLRVAESYSINSMAQAFADGVVLALDAYSRTRRRSVSVL